MVLMNGTIKGRKLSTDFFGELDVVTRGNVVTIYKLKDEDMKAVAVIGLRNHNIHVFLMVRDNQIRLGQGLAIVSIGSLLLVIHRDNDLWSGRRRDRGISQEFRDNRVVADVVSNGKNSKVKDKVEEGGRMVVVHQGRLYHAEASTGRFSLQVAFVNRRFKIVKMVHDGKAFIINGYDEVVGNVKNQSSTSQARGHALLGFRNILGAFLHARLRNSRNRERNLGGEHLNAESINNSQEISFLINVNRQNIGKSSSWIKAFCEESVRKFDNI